MATKDPVIRIKAKDDTKGAFGKVSSKLGDLKKKVFNLQTAMIAAAGVTAMGALIKSAIDSADQIGKLSDRIGISTEALSQYKHVAELSAVPFNQLTIGIQRMVRRVSEAASGTGEASNALKELGLNAQNLEKLSIDRQFELIADQLNNLESSTDKVRLAQKLFDSEGVALLQTMKKGAAGIREMRESADELGLTLSRDQVNAAAAAKDALTELGASTKAVQQALALNLAQPLADITKQLADAIPKAVTKTNEAMVALGVVYAAIWSWMNPSEITGPTTLAESLAEVADAAVDLEIKLNNLKTKTTVSIIPTADELTAEREVLKVHYDQVFEDFRAHRRSLSVANKTAGENDLAFNKLSGIKKTKTALGEAIKLTSGVAFQSRKLFEVNKAAAIASAVIDAHASFNRTMGAYPYPLNIALAGLSLAASLAQVQAIKSASFSGGGGGGGSGAGGGIPPTPPSDYATPVPDQFNRGPTEISITIDGTGVLDRDQAEAIAESLREIIADGAAPI